MLKSYLPTNIYNALKKYLNLIDLNEIRLRVNAPIIVTLKNKKYYLGEQGFTDRNNAIFCDYITLQSLVYKMCESSVYSVNDYLKCGFITLKGGFRVGVCGEVVSENGIVKTIKNFQSINIRVPHNIDGCSARVLDYLIQDTFLNTLIISPPGAGKTTFIRDIVKELAKRNYSYNILVADERNEIANIQDGEQEVSLGDFADIYSNSSKEYAFKYGIRSMRPDIIVTDEIDIDKDLQTIIDATTCGVKVLATIHSDNIHSVKNKRGFDKIVENNIFERFVVLSCQEGPGTINGVFDNKFKCIFCR